MKPLKTHEKKAIPLEALPTNTISDQKPNNSIACIDS